MKKLIGELSQENPYLKRSLLRALGNVHPRHLLDKSLNAFGGTPLGHLEAIDAS